MVHTVSNLHRRLLQPCPIQNPAPKPSRNSTEPALLDLGEEDVVLVREPLVVAPDLADDAVLLRAVRALGVVLPEASAHKRSAP